MLKLWWGAPEGDLLSLAWQVRPPTFVKAYSAGVDCIFTLVLPCDTFAESSDKQIHSAYPTLLRYHRALCLGRQDVQSRRISQPSNVKKLTRFIVTSWIVGSYKGHDSAFWSVRLFYHRTSTSPTRCQDMFGNITTYFPKVCQLTSVLLIMRVVRQSQQKRNKNTKQEEFLHFFWLFYSRSRFNTYLKS